VQAKCGLVTILVQAAQLQKKIFSAPGRFSAVKLKHL